MNKNLVSILILIFIHNSCISQNSNKKTYYFFENNEISKTEFISFNKDRVYIKKTENDSSIIQNIYSHKNTGILDSIQLKQITALLSKIIGSKFQNKKKTLIHLYSQKDKTIRNDSKHISYWNWIKRNSNEYQSFLIGTKDSQIKANDRKSIYLDQYDILKNLFFKKSDFKINHILLKPNGEFYVYFGMNDILQVLNWSTSKYKNYPSYIIGEKKFERVLVNKDSLQIVTPNVEIYNSSAVEKADYVNRKKLQISLIEKLKTELNKSEVYELELMSKDYLMVNNVLEMIRYKKSNNPDLIMAAPNEIITPNIKYSVLVTVFGYYGKAERSTIIITLINNVDEIIESIDMKTFYFSPLNNDLIEKKLIEVLSIIIKT